MKLKDVPILLSTAHSTVADVVAVVSRLLEKNKYPCKNRFVKFICLLKALKKDLNCITVDVT